MTHMNQNTDLKLAIENTRLVEIDGQPIAPKLLHSDYRAAHSREVIQHQSDDAKYQSTGILPADLKIEESPGTLSPRQNLKLFELQPTQMKETLPPIPETLEKAPYTSSIKFNTGITNVPEVTRRISGE